MTSRLKCARSAGRWWLVYPLFCSQCALAFWLAKQWQPSESVATFAVIPDIIVYFSAGVLVMLVERFNQATKSVELRTTACLLLMFAILSFALYGTATAIGLMTWSAERTEKITAISFFFSVFGLAWMLAYCFTAGVLALRESRCPGKRHRYAQDPTNKAERLRRRRFGQSCH